MANKTQPSNRSDVCHMLCAAIIAVSKNSLDKAFDAIELAKRELTKIDDAQKLKHQGAK